MAYIAYVTMSREAQLSKLLLHSNRKNKFGFHFVVTGHAGDGTYILEITYSR